MSLLLVILVLSSGHSQSDCVMFAEIDRSPRFISSITRLNSLKVPKTHLPFSVFIKILLCYASFYLNKVFTLAKLLSETLSQVTV